MKSDYQIQIDVMDQFKWDPFLHASEIGVGVKNGIVTLSGRVDSYFKKRSLEESAKKVAGVKAVAMDIQIGISPTEAKTDTEIAEAILHALKWHTAVKEEKIKISVEDGDVTLEGEVEWEFEKANAQHAIENLEGIKSITNLITIQSKVTPENIQRKIEGAFQRSASINSRRIDITVSGAEVTLNGDVSSLAEKEDAEYAALNIQGVTKVNNYLAIRLPDYSEYSDFEER